MIVIPTYNGYWHLKNLLTSLEKHGTGGHRIVVVNNHTTDTVSKKYLDSLFAEDVTIITPDTPNYEAGALVHAVRAFPEEEKAILLHDSCEVLHSDWIKEFEEKLTEQAGAVCWVKFRPCLYFMFSHHLEYIDSVLGGHSDVPDGGFFGGIFYTYTNTIKQFDKDGVFAKLPTAKIHSEAWERIWAIIYHTYGYKTECLVDGFNPERIHFGVNLKLRKTFAGR